MRSLISTGVVAIILQAVPAIAAAGEQTLYAASFSGTLTTLSLVGSDSKGNASLRAVDTKTDCGPQATWLTLDSRNSVLYCLDESWEPINGTLTSYKIAADGSLTHLDSILTVDSPVSATIYGEGGRGLAVSY